MHSMSKEKGHTFGMAVLWYLLSHLHYVSNEVQQCIGIVCLQLWTCHGESVKTD